MRALLTARASSLRPLVVQGQRVLDMHQQLSRMLAARTGDPAMALLLARPRLPSRRDEIVWDSPAQGEAVRLAQASPDLRAAGEQRFEAAFAAVQDVIQALRGIGDDARQRDAAALEAALRHPSDGDLFLVGGTPVLINWGCAPAEASEAPSAPARRPRAPVEVAASASAAETPVHHATRALPPPLPTLGGGGEVVLPRGWLMAWGAVAALAIAIPFAVRSALTSPAEHLQAQRSAFQASVGRLRALAAQARASRQACPPGEWTAPVFAQRLAAAKASVAPVAALAWNGAARLELEIKLPSGRSVAAGQAGAALQGGEDVAQRVSWLGSAGPLPKGRYAVSVRLADADPPPERPASWAVEITPPGQPPVVKAGFLRAADGGVTVPVFDFDTAGPR